MTLRVPRPTAARVLAPGLLCLALLAAGCGTQRTATGTDPLQPGAAATSLLGPGGMGPGALDEMRGNGLFHMPLDVGDRWDFSIRMQTRLVTEGAPDQVQSTESPWTSEITGEQLIDGHEYHLQAEYDPRVVGPLPAAQFALRQDRSGLFQLDQVQPVGRATAAPAGGEALAARFEAAAAEAYAGSPHRAAFAAAAARLGERLAFMGMPGGIPGRGGHHGPGMPGVPGLGGLGGFNRGGPLPGEISLLRYPLFMGARWAVRDVSPRFTRVVVGRERMDLPAGRFVAWKLRGDSELFGPHDRAHFWYARQGLIRLTLHAESDATDEQGNVIGTMIADVDQVLTGLRLAPAVAQD